MHLPVTTLEYGIHPVYFCSAHHVEMLLKAELPLVCSAFHMSGFTPSQVTDQSVLKYHQPVDLNYKIKNTEELLGAFSKQHLCGGFKTEGKRYEHIVT